MGLREKPGAVSGSTLDVARRCRFTDRNVSRSVSWGLMAPTTLRPQKVFFAGAAGGGGLAGIRYGARTSIVVSGVTVPTYANELGTHAPLLGARREDNTPSSFSIQFVRTIGRERPAAEGLCRAGPTRETRAPPSARVPVDESVESDEREAPDGLRRIVTRAIGEHAVRIGLPGSDGASSELPSDDATSWVANPVGIVRWNVRGRPTSLSSQSDASDSSHRTVFLRFDDCRLSPRFLGFSQYSRAWRRSGKCTTSDVAAVGADMPNMEN